MSREHPHNEELEVMLRAVNRNTTHIHSLHRHLPHFPQGVQAMPIPDESVESRASNEVTQPPQLCLFQ
jgi:hypothetical protein